MSVSTYATKEQYNGNGITDIFPFTFRVTLSSDIFVIVTDANGIDIPQTENTEYMVTINEDLVGGNIIFDEDYIPTFGSIVSVYRLVDLTQETVYVENDPFHAKTHEEALDKLTMITQQLDEALGRSITIPITSTITDLKISPKPNMLIGFNSDASALALYGTAASNHNDFAGLQGGKIAEYYHLTSSEYTELKDVLNTPYIQIETDPVFTAWDKSTGISITESQISDFGTYLTAASTGITANSWTINSGRANVTSTLTFGRAAGGDATISYAGSSLMLNRNISITGTTDTVNITLESVYGTTGYIRGVKDVDVGSHAYVGFLDSSGDWTYQISKDPTLTWSDHRWYINNTLKMLLTPDVFWLSDTNVMFGGLIVSNIPGDSVRKETIDDDWAFGYGASHYLMPSTSLVEWGMCGTDYTVDYGYFGPTHTSNYLRIYPTYTHVYGNLLVENNSLTLNSSKSNVTSTLTFGRTTGGDATISWDGVSQKFNNQIEVTGSNNFYNIVAKGPSPDSTGALCGIAFSALNLSNRIKAAIGTVWEGLSWGLQDLVFAVRSTADNTNVTLADEKMRIAYDGTVKIANNLYVGGNVSAESFTDRTPFYEGDAVTEIMNIKGKDGEIDHSSLPSFARKEITKRRFEDVELTTEVDAKDAYTYDTRTVEVKGVEQEEIIEDSKRLKDTVYEDEKTGKFYEKYSVGEVKIKDGKPYQNIDVGEEIEQGRDLGAMISMLTVAVQQLKNEINELKKQRGQ